MKHEKKLLFTFSIFSLIGFLSGLEAGREHSGGFGFVEFFQIWIGFSTPLIIQNTYSFIFRDKEMAKIREPTKGHGMRSITRSELSFYRKSTRNRKEVISPLRYSYLH